MARMNDIAVTLDEFECFLFQRGYGDKLVTELYQELCTKGFKTEADLIRMEFDTLVFNGELENF